jgi:addiction module HigA family antidote
VFGFKGQEKHTYHHMTTHLPPTHPGEVLFEEFLKPMCMSQYRLARDIHVPPRRINEIVHGTRSISANTALRLARRFGTSAQFWMNLQTAHDIAKEQHKHGTQIEKEVSACL